MTAYLGLRAVLEQLKAEGFSLPEGWSDSAAEALKEKATPKQAWYLRLFVGVSAWSAAFLFTVFLFEAEILSDERGILLLGIVFIGLAVGINILNLRNEFSGQFGLALSLTGQALSIFGLAQTSTDSFIVPGLIIALELALILVYDDRLHRVLSTMVIVGTTVYVIFDWEVLGLLHVLILALAIGAVFFSLRERQFQTVGKEDLFQPVRLGISISLLGVLLLPIGSNFLPLRSWWIAAMILLWVLLSLILEIAKDLAVDWKSGAVPWLIFGSMILFFPALRMPGILGAVLLLLLGFWRGNRLLMGLASLFLLSYIGAFYYSLDWTLMQKSVGLMGTGLLMLLLRYLVLEYRTGEEP